MNDASNLRDILRSDLMRSFYLPSLLYGISQAMLLPVLPLYIRDFTDNYGVVGLVLGGAALGMVIADLPSGAVLRKLGTKRTMVLGALMIVAGGIGLVVAQSVLFVMIAQFIAGMGGALFGISRHDYITSAVVLSSRGRAIGLLGGTFRISRFIGPVVGAFVAEAFGIRTTFGLMTILFSLTLLIVLMYVEQDDPKPQVDDKSPQGSLLQLWQVLRAHYQILGIAGLAQVLIQMTREGSKAVIPLFGADILGLGEGAIGIILSIGSLFDSLFFYVSGWVMDHYGRKFAIVPSFIIQGIGLLIIPFTLSFAGLLLASSIIGFGNALSAGTMMSLGADLSPSDARGEFLALWRFMGDGGMAGAPIVVGQVAAIFQLATAAVVLGLISFTAAGMVTAFVPETLKKDALATH